MTHGGVTKTLLDDLESYMKEFLSCVRELDVRLRHNILSKACKVEGMKDKKSTEDKDEPAERARAPAVKMTKTKKKRKQKDRKRFG